MQSTSAARCLNFNRTSFLPPLDIFLNWYLSLYKLGTPKWLPSRGVLRVRVRRLHQSSSHLLGSCVAGLVIRAKYIPLLDPSLHSLTQNKVRFGLSLGPAGILFFRIL